MNREEALDWLARNLHEWSDASISYAYSNSDHVFGRSEWQDRRAELQGKPRFEDHPDAKCFVQHNSGRWHKNTKTDAVEHSEPSWWVSRVGGWIYVGKGEVLGDWRDTLERRPDNKPSTESKENHDEVNNPKHYDLFPDSQSIDVIKNALTPEEWRGFLKGNVLKYRLRAGEKGSAETCLAKSNWYKDKLWSGHNES